MNESQLTKRMLPVIRAGLPGAVVFKHWDHLTVMPDVSVTWNGRTTWIEVKLTPGLRSALNARDAQTLMMRRLHRAGRAVYVIFVAKPARTYIIQADQVEAWSGPQTLMIEGHRPEFVAEYLYRAHTGELANFVIQHGRS